MSTHNKKQRHFLDQLISTLDQGLRTCFVAPKNTRTSPAASTKEQPLTVKESRHSAGLMRVNHTGEVCAQALYQGQALTARDPKIRDTMQQAASEENDHLAWCHERLSQLHSRPSVLNVFWYFSSLSLGIAAGIAGDSWSLGFLAETEKQVTDHLNKHLRALPENDQKSAIIVDTMRTEEAQHQHTALEAGGKPLPFPLPHLMRGLSKLMTTTTYWL